MQLLNTEDAELRLNALWAFKNLLYKATPDLKRQVMNNIGWTDISKYVYLAVFVVLGTELQLVFW